MANAFSKEEMVAFDDLCEEFEDTLVLSRNVSKYGTDGQLMERANDTIWRPYPYILNSQDRIVGSAVTFQDVTQLSVPSTLGYEKTVPWTLSAKELRDVSQWERQRKGAAQRLASDINVAIRDKVSLEGSLVVDITGAAGDYNDIALCESMMDEQGVPAMDRYMALCTRDYNGLAGDLAARQTLNEMAGRAYKQSYIGEVANFQTFKIQNGTRLAANSATVTIDTTGAQVQYVPVSTRTAATGERSNVDNRYQQVTVSTTTGVTAGDAFTVNGLESVHHIDKTSTGQAKTFRVVSVDSATTMTVTPPMIGANQASPTDAELAYKNIEVASTSATAAITFLNDTAAPVNPFWSMDAVELMPGRYEVPTDEGVAVLNYTSDQGVQLVLTKQFSGSTFESQFTLNTFFGVTITNTEMCGALIFGQS